MTRAERRLRDAVARLARRAAPLRGRGGRAAEALLSLLDEAEPDGALLLDARVGRWLEVLFDALILRLEELEAEARRARQQPWRRW